MADPYLSQISIFAFAYRINEYAYCDGTTLEINQNGALFSLLGIKFGGDGRLTFKLPDLRGRTPIQYSKNHPLGESKGSETVVLTASNMPAHNHLLLGTGKAGNSVKATNSVPAVAQDADSSLQFMMYSPPANNQIVVPMSTKTCDTIGASLGHYNMQSFLTLNFCIATSGTYPPRS